MFHPIRKLRARRHGLAVAPPNSVGAIYETLDRSKALWREDGKWCAYGSDFGLNAARYRKFRKLKDASRYARFPDSAPG